VIFVVLAGTQDRTAQILAEWGNDGIDAAKTSLWIDYAFIVAYGLSWSWRPGRRGTSP
jgi:hypothetical protein